MPEHCCNYNVYCSTNQKNTLQFIRRIMLPGLSTLDISDFDPHGAFICLRALSPSPQSRIGAPASISCGQAPKFARLMPFQIRLPQNVNSATFCSLPLRPCFYCHYYFISATFGVHFLFTKNMFLHAATKSITHV